MKPGDPGLAPTDYVLVARPADALAAAAARACTMDLDVVNLGSDLQGEARDMGAAHAELARQHAPGVLISAAKRRSPSMPGAEGVAPTANTCWHSRWRWTAPRMFTL